MKLLICTQVVDRADSNLGFFHTWVEEFAKHCEKVTVICLREGDHELPANVHVLSLGKERNSSRLVRMRHFFSYIRGYKNKYDAVFVHMNPEYVLLGGYFWRRWSKKIALWYAHKSITLKLRLAVRLADIIFSVSTTSFGIATPKLHAVGHGIDTELFKPTMRETAIGTRLITTGRIAASKNLIEMLRVLDVLHERGNTFTFTVVGAPITPAETRYARLLETEIDKRPYKHKVHIVGVVPHDSLPALLNAHDIFLNFSATGNMDKAGLEALACGVPVVTTNAAFRDLLVSFGLFVAEKNYNALADAVTQTMHRTDKVSMMAILRNKVIAEHSLSRLIPRILQDLAVQ